MSNKHYNKGQNQSTPLYESERPAPAPAPVREPAGGSSQNTWRLIVVLIIGIVVGFFIGALVFGLEKEDRDGDAQVSESDDAATTTLGEAFDTDGRSAVPGASVVTEGLVLVKDQPAGMSVFLSRVELERDGWVAIQDDGNGKPQNILGAQRFDAGVYQGTVTLLRATEAGKKYHATLWQDDGDKMFDLAADMRVADVGMMFEVY